MSMSIPLPPPDKREEEDSVDAAAEDDEIFVLEEDTLDELITEDAFKLEEEMCSDILSM